MDVPLSAEYLSVLDELLECRDDDRLKLLQARFQQVARFEGVGPRADSFVESYIRDEAALHVHWRSCIGNIGQRGDFCAVIQAADAGTRQKSIGIREVMANGETGQENVRMLVFVDVRKFSDDPQDVVDSWPCIVRLHTLDECISCYGNPRKILLEELIGNGEGIRDERIAADVGGFHAQGKLTISLPSIGQRLSLGVGLDQLECKLIERRPELINDFPRYDPNVIRGTNKEMKCFFTVRIGKDFIRVFGFSEIADDRMDLIDVYRYPSEFSFGKRYATNHAS